MKIELDEISLKDYVIMKEIERKNRDGLYESRIEYYADLISIATKKSQEEIDDLDLNSFKELANSINIAEINNKDFINELKIDGVTYITNATNNTFIFKVNEIQQLEKTIKDSGNELDIAAIVFREKGDNDKPVNDFSREGIENRKKVFENDMKIKHIFPYMLKLSEYLSK